MAWLKLTGAKDGKRVLLNSNEALVIETGRDDKTIVWLPGQTDLIVKESLEEIEAMLNKNQQRQKVEHVAMSTERDYIGSPKQDESPFQGQDSSFYKRGI